MKTDFEIVASPKEGAGLGVFRRIRDIGAATVHDWLEQAEDPLRMMDRRLKELHKQLVHLEQLDRQCQVHGRVLRRQLADAEALRQKRKQQAELAMKAGEEEICRLALAEKLHYEEKCEEYESLVADWERTRRAVQTQLFNTRSEYQTLLERRKYYLARLVTVRLQQQLCRQSQGGLQPERDLLRAVEEYISEVELEVRAWQDIRLMKPGDRYYPAAEDDAVLSAEIERLRQQLTQEGCQG